MTRPWPPEMINRMMEHEERHHRSHELTARFMQQEFGDSGFKLGGKDIARQYRRHRAKMWRQLHPRAPYVPKVRRPEHKVERFQFHELSPVGHPFVKILYRVLNRERMSFGELERIVGLGKGTVHNWRHHAPKVPDLEACFNALEMTMKPREDDECK